MEPDRPFDVVAVALGDARDQGEVLLLDRALLELLGELPVGEVVLGDDQQAGGVAVEAVDDPGPLGAAGGGERVVMELEAR